MQPQQPNSTEPKSVPPVPFSFTQHLSDTWNLFTRNILSLIGLMILSGVTQIILVSGTLGGIVWWGMQKPEIQRVIKDIGNSNPESLLSLPASFWYELSGWFVLYLLISTFLVSGFMAAMVRKVESESNMGFWESVTKGFSRALPLTLFSILASLLIIGGMMPFIIPGLGAFFFLSLAWYELVLTRNSILGAIRRSTQMVSANFALVLGRVLALFAFSIVLSMISQSMMRISDFALWGGLFSVIGSYGITLFSIPYFILLYKHVDRKTPHTASTNALWVYLISIIGLALLGTTIYLGVIKGAPFVREQIMQEVSKEKPLSNSAINFPYTVPSSCGVQIPLTGTVEKETGRKWIYEERFVSAKSFRGLVPEAQSNSVGTLMSMVSFKTNDERIPQVLKPGETFSTSYSGFNLVCTANSGKLTLSEFVEQAQGLKSAKVTLSQEQVFGKIKTQGIWIEGVDQGGDFYKEPLFLGVTENGENLFYIKIWGSEDDRVTQETNAILDNLSFNETIKPVQDPQL